MTEDFTFTGIAHGNDKLMVVGSHRGGLDGVAFWSTDGKNWRGRSLRDKQALMDLAFGNGRFVAAGETGIYSSR